MADNTHKILTELWVEIMKISQPERDPISFYFSKKTQAAIKTAVDKIAEQQRERVEKMKLYTTHLDNCRYWAGEKCNCGLETAFVELEAEGE